MLLYIIGLIFFIIFLLFQFGIIKIVEKFGCGCRYCKLCTGNQQTCRMMNILGNELEGFNNFSIDWNQVQCPLCERRRGGYGLNRFMTYGLGLGKWAGEIDELKSSDSMKFYRGDPSKCPIRRMLFKQTK